MPLWLKSAGKWGTILALIALVIALVKQLIAFVGFLTFAIKALLVIAFIAVFAGVGYLIFRSWSDSKSKK